MSRSWKAALVGLAVAAIGVAAAAIPSISALEDSIALRWLFLARGRVAPPPQVAIVSIDEGTSARLSLPARVRDWPRSIHGELVDRLVEHGASAIAFDVEFFRDSPDPSEDERFAAAIARAGRVIIVERFRVARAGTGEIWERQRPIPSLANAALAVAPVPLPDRPLVTSSWSFINTPYVSDVPSLAAATLQVHLLDEFSEFQRLLGAHQPSLRLISEMQSARRAVLTDASHRTKLHDLLARKADPPHTSSRPALIALANLYLGRSASFLNFYGPPGQICTVPYDEVLRNESGGACHLERAAVFIGAGTSRIARADQQDSYRTVFGRSDGTDFTGVEIHATAFANLLTGRTLEPVGPITHLVALLGVGFAVGGFAYLIRTRKRWHAPVAPRLRAAGATVASAAVYSGICYLCFSRFDLILPLAIPILFQLPVALIVALAMGPTKYVEEAYAVCLVTDGVGSTAIGEKVSHASYSRLLCSYQDDIDGRVLKRGGIPMSPEGDGRLCVWLRRDLRAVDDAALRREVCLAALEICREAQLQTRAGLHTGVVTVKSDADRGPHTITGQTVNIAARLEEAATFGTRVLASQLMAEGLSETLLLGQPQLIKAKGLSPVEAVEVLGQRSVSNAEQTSARSPTVGAA
jgi:adenylate cyclase